MSVETFRGNPIAPGLAMGSLRPGMRCGSGAHPETFAAELGKALGQEVTYDAVTPDAYRGLGFPGAEDLGNMFQLKRDFEEYFCGVRDPDLARRLNPALKTFGAWLGENKGRIPLG